MSRSGVVMPKQGLMFLRGETSSDWLLRYYASNDPQIETNINQSEDVSERKNIYPSLCITTPDLDILPSKISSK